MGFKIIIVITITVALCLTIYGAPSELGIDVTVLTDPTCMGQKLTYSEKLNMTMDKCWAKYNSEPLNEFLDKYINASDSDHKGAIPFEKLACPELCEFQEFKIITSDYKYDSSQVKNYLNEANMTEKAIADITKEWEACFTIKGVNLEPKGKNCSSAIPALECVEDVYQKVCYDKK